MFMRKKGIMKLLQLRFIVSNARRMSLPLSRPQETTDYLPQKTQEVLIYLLTVAVPVPMMCIFIVKSPLYFL